MMIAAISLSSFADVQLASDRGHLVWGLGMAFSKVPFSLSKLKLPLSYLAYDHQFTDPEKMVRYSAEVGMYGFEVIVPVPEAGANLYIGRESSKIQGKIGLSGFYDIAVGGHAGMAVKTGLIFSNRFDVSLMIVPTGRDADRSYLEVMGLQSKEEAAQFRLENDGKNVLFPYFGFMVTLRH